MILFSGCSQGKLSELLQGELIEPLQSEQVQQGERTDRELLIAAEKWLGKDFSFTMTYEFMNLAINGMQQRSELVFGKDGSWSMQTERQAWDHSTDYSYEETARFYYRYEGSQLVCYSNIDGDEPQRIAISDSSRKEIEASKALMVGVPALMPDYLEGLYVTNPVGNNAVTVLAYWLPVEKVLADDTMLSAYVNNAFALSGNTYPPEANAGILTVFQIDTQTCQPISLDYMFHEVKPYVLSAGAQSGEEALDADFMTMSYSFDYDIPETVTGTEEMIP